LEQAEKDQVKYHAPGKFDAKTGEIIQNRKNIYQ
jgi:1-deoxy-D-xylulose-5-phosphate synthase